MNISATAAAVSVCTTMAAASAWLPWTRSGEASRSSFETFRTAQRLGLDALTPLRVVWFLIPVVALAAVLALLLGRAGIGIALAAIVGVIVGASGLLVALSPAAHPVGPWLAAVAGGLVVVSAIGELFWTQGRRTP